MILTDSHFTAGIVPFTNPICRDFEICIPCFAVIIEEKEANNCRIEDCRGLLASVSTNQIDPSSRRGFRMRWDERGRRAELPTGGNRCLTH